MDSRQSYSEVNGLEGLTVYRKAFALAMDIFQLSKNFPAEERFSLTDQMRRSSRAICANLGEAYRKRIYAAHFIAKVSDADAENEEPCVWLQFALRCGYLPEEKFQQCMDEARQIGKLLHHMMTHLTNYGVHPPSK